MRCLVMTDNLFKYLHDKLEERQVIHISLIGHLVHKSGHTIFIG